MENKKKQLTRRQEIVLQLYRQGLTQEQISIKLFGNKYFQGNISRHLISISNKGYVREIEELKQKNRDKITPALSGKWLEIEKELSNDI